MQNAKQKIIKNKTKIITGAGCMLHAASCKLQQAVGTRSWLQSAMAKIKLCVPQSSPRIMSHKSNKQHQWQKVYKKRKKSKVEAAKMLRKIY